MPRRESDDRCPGVLRPFSAADGAIVRLRVPGGRVSTGTLHAVTRLAREFGQPFVQVTSRGNLQLRGLAEPVPEAFVDAVDALGLLPSVTHDRVRTIVAEPDPALDDLVVRLDEQILADPRLPALSGRWVFAVSVTTDWLDQVPYDVAFHQNTTTSGSLIVGDRWVACSPADAPKRLVEIAALFTQLTADDGAWNVRDLAPGHPFFAVLGERSPRAAAPCVAAVGPGGAGDEHRAPRTHRGPIASCVLHLPLGMLDEPLAAALVDEADEVVVTPDRSIVVRHWRPGVTGREAERRLVQAGFVTDESSAGTRFSACIGAPWCRRTATPTLEITRRAVQLTDGSASGDPVRTHVVGCERACGRPTAPHRLIVAPPDVSAVTASPTSPPDPRATPSAPTRG